MKTLFRGSAIAWVARLAATRAIQFKLDSAHPPGCSHHQKIVVIDDCFAICGGIDMTGDRWDRPAHADDDPGRVRPNGKPYGPWHDATMAVDGRLAAALGELACDRWERARSISFQFCFLARARAKARIVFRTSRRTRARSGRA